MKVALVHDYLTQTGGAERVFGSLAGLFPDADLFAGVSDPGVAAAVVGPRAVQTTFLQRPYESRVPLAILAPLFAKAFGRLDLASYDLVLSSSSGFAHHARVDPGAVHIVYCYNPPRFLWQPAEYFRDRRLGEVAMRPVSSALRRADRNAARRADRYLAISAAVGDRVGAAYGRDATVVHPPLDVSCFAPDEERSGRFLAVARLRGYKRIDLAVAAANELGVELDVIGCGPGLARLRRLAGPSVRVLGWQPDDVVRRAMARCVALVVPGCEDFGLTMVEAQASGRPPVAFAAGGALEIIDDGRTGFFFHEQTVEAVAHALRRAETHTLHPSALMEAARRFDIAAFGRALMAVIEKEMRSRARAPT